MERRHLSLAALLTVLFVFPSVAQQRAVPPAPITRALQDEVQRAMNVLTQKGSPAPYFINYQVNEVQ